MKKLILILAILVVASPAFAVLDVNLARIGTTNQVQIYYKGADPCNLPRGFALVVEVSSTADVCSIRAYKVGESNSTSRGYGIYPAKIQFTGADQNKPSGWGDPIAEATDPLPPNADQVLPSKKLVLEFGSLYAPVRDWANAPSADGNLCILGYEPNASTSFTIKMTGEGLFRITNGPNTFTGVVFENGTTADVNASVTIASTECYKSTSPSYAAWVTFGSPDCWCFQRQCRGDADGIKSGLYWVYTPDLTILQGSFNKNDATLLTTVVNGVKGVCADFDHSKSGLYRVYTSDLTALQGYFGKGAASVPVCDSNLVNSWKN